MQTAQSTEIWDFYISFNSERIVWLNGLAVYRRELVGVNLVHDLASICYGSCDCDADCILWVDAILSSKHSGVVVKYSACLLTFVKQVLCKNLVMSDIVIFLSQCKSLLQISSIGDVITAFNFGTLSYNYGKCLE